MSLTVAITGPTGEVGRSLLLALEGMPEVAEVRGMARRPLEPELGGLAKLAYGRGDVLDRDAVAALVEGADVVVHLAFSIFGGRERTRRVNLEGSRNVFEATRAAGARRLVYTSSVAAYGFERSESEPLTESTPVAGSAGFYYSAQKAELEATLEEVVAGSELETYVFRPCLVAGPRATMLIRQTVHGARLGDPLPGLRRRLGRLPLPRPVLPDTGVRIQLVHHDDVAVALAAAVAGAGPPGAYNLAAEGEVGIGDVARSIGWRAVPVPGPAASAGAGLARRFSFAVPQLEWATAIRHSVPMDTAKARRELAWEPRFDASETLLQTAVAAREEGLLD